MQPESQPSFADAQVEGDDDAPAAAASVDSSEDPMFYNTWRKILKPPYTKPKLRALLRELLSGLTVSLAQVPEAVAFSFTAGVPPLVGLQAAWIVGLVTALFGGAPGMVSGATGALAVVLPDFVEEYGLGYLFITVLLMGILQVIFGLIGGGKLVKLIGNPVMLGFCNGLAIVIGAAQFHSFKEPAYSPVPCDSSDFSSNNLTSTQSDAYPYKCDQWITGAEAAFQALEVVMTMLVIWKLPRLTKLIPGSLAGILVGTLIEFAIVRPAGYETPTVGDLGSIDGSFPIPIWLDDQYADTTIPSLGDAETYKICLPISATMAIIGLVESLMTLQLVGEITQKKPSPKAEAIAQGAANILTGILGGMGGCAMIGQSMINVKAGGVTRISTSFAAAFLLVIILAAYPLINYIPVASLAGVMFMVVIGTFEWHSIPIVIASFLPAKVREHHKTKWLRKIKRSDAFIILLVTVVAVAANLAYAVGAGVVLGALVFAWDQEKRLHVIEVGEEMPLKGENDTNDGANGDVPSVEEIQSMDSGIPDGFDAESIKVYQIKGPLFFASGQKFISLFNPDNDPDCVILYLDQAVLSDYSAMVALNQVARKYQAAKKTLLLRKVTGEDIKVLRKAHHLLYVYDKTKADDVNESELLSMELAPRWQGKDMPMYTNYDNKHKGVDESIELQSVQVEESLAQT